MRETYISVIVPVYNVEKYIKRCMDSLVNQSLDNYEIIVVDDGTPDNSMQYVMDLQAKYENIVIVRRENGGLSAARNTGLQHATGKYVLFCDSDDSLQPETLKKLYDEAEGYELDAVLFDARVLSENGEEHKTVKNYYDRKHVSDNAMTGGEMLNHLIEQDEYRASACMYLIKRNIIEDYHLTFYEGIIHEDELFTPILLAFSNKVVHRNWLLYNRYERQGSIMQNGNLSRRAEGLCVVVRELEKWMTLNEVSVELTKAFNKLLLQHIRQVLGYYAGMTRLTAEQKKNEREMHVIAKERQIRLGVVFKIYLVKQKLKTQFAEYFDKTCRKGSCVK